MQQHPLFIKHLPPVEQIILDVFMSGSIAHCIRIPQKTAHKYAQALRILLRKLNAIASLVAQRIFCALVKSPLFLGLLYSFLYFFQYM
jgi:hypothetical protein